MAANNNNAKIWQDAVSATQECPGIEVLEKVMEGAEADPKASSHVSTCPHCQSEIAMLQKFEYSEPAADEGAAVAWIAARLERNQTVRAAKPTAKVIPFWRNVFRVPYMAAAAALLVAITLGISLYRSGDSGKPPINVGSGEGVFRGQIHLVSPAGDLTLAPEQFLWDAVPGASSYSIEITGMDIDRTLVWKGQSGQNSLTVDSELKARIRPGKPLVWKVTALDAAGKELATGEGRFRFALNIKNNQ